MLETFTPAVCGSRNRRRVAVALFAVSALAAAAALGAVLGAAGEMLGARRAVLVAAALALVAAAREAGVVRLPLPQARRQVPERWRAELPLPVWASGYGAGLGAGIFTFQPVATFWVAVLAALALARPLSAAVCFSLYGAGRALMLAWPSRRSRAPSELAERLAGRRRGVVRANAAALVACAVLLALAPAANGAYVTAGLDPSTSAGALAYARANGSVVVRPATGTAVAYAGASEPALDGSLLAYRDAAGIRVVNWKTGVERARVGGPVSLPALDWPLLAFVREGNSGRRLVVRDLETGVRKSPAVVPKTTQLGRPSLQRGRLAWHMARRDLTRINVLWLATGRRRVVAASRIGRLTSPALYRSRIVWVDERSGVTYLWIAYARGGGQRVVAKLRRRDYSFWTTALGPGVAYVTRWRLATGTAGVHKLPL